MEHDKAIAALQQEKAELLDVLKEAVFLLEIFARCDTGARIAQKAHAVIDRVELHS